MSRTVPSKVLRRWHAAAVGPRAHSHGVFTKARSLQGKTFAL